jgi:anti-sigma regulatory factor (Ser/Thr protein kinase)
MTASFPDSYAGPGARHQAFFYASPDEFASTTAPFVAEAVELGDSSIVVTSAENLEALRGSFDRLPPLLFLVDADDWYRNPAETTGRWMAFVEGQVARGRPRVRGVGEIVSLRRGRGVERWLEYESVLNDLLTPLPLWVLCAYNTAVLPDSIIQSVRRSHPTVIENGSVSASTTYMPLDPAATRPLVLDGKAQLTHRPVDAPSACKYVELKARRAGIPEWHLQRFVAAVGEVARNAFDHGRDPVFVTAWTDPESFICQIEDSGSGKIDLHTGYSPPSNGNHGWGLWLARQITDSLEIGRGPFGSAIRLTMRRDPGKAPGGASLFRV